VHANYTEVCSEQGRRDGDGNRVQKSNGKIYWYGAGTEILEETTFVYSTTNASLSAEYVYFDGKRVARHDASGNFFFYMQDGLGTTDGMVEITAGLTETVCYDADFYPFGGEKVFTNTCGQNYKFTGKERDTETSNDDFGARYYSSTYGRFMSPDPAGMMAVHIGNPQSLNRYSYVLNNPLSLTDPFGLDCVYLDAVGGTDAENGGYLKAGASIDHNSTKGECETSDGLWFDGTIANLKDVSADPNSNWVGARYTNGGGGAQCEGPLDACGNEAFSAYFGNTNKVFINGDQEDVPLTLAALTVLGGVDVRLSKINKGVTSVASVILPYLPAPNPDDLSDAILGTGEGGAEIAKGAAESAANKIKGAARQGPSRLARIAKLEARAGRLAKASKALGALSIAKSTQEAYKNYQENCK
jgi:RHS repeat-associated protein